MAAYSIIAFGVKLSDTRRSICAGFFMRSFFAVYTQLPHFVTPKIDQMSSDATGSIMDEQGE